MKIAVIGHKRIPSNEGGIEKGVEQHAIDKPKSHGYSFTQLLIVARKYFYVFYAYPIIYIFSMDNDAHKFINKIYWISMLLLTIKSATWYLYNFRGVTIFSGLLLQYSESWTRNGFIRMDTGMCLI